MIRYINPNYNFRYGVPNDKTLEILAKEKDKLEDKAFDLSLASTPEKLKEVKENLENTNQKIFEHIMKIRKK